MLTRLLFRYETFIKTKRRREKRDRFLNSFLDGKKKEKKALNHFFQEGNKNCSEGFINRSN
jgi:hypothetical protein